MPSLITERIDGKDYVIIMTDNALSRDDILSFYKIVDKVAGDIIDTSDSEGKPVTHYMENNKHNYCIYLSRPLNAEELEICIYHASVNVMNNKTKVELIVLFFAFEEIGFPTVFSLLFLPNLE